MKLAFALLLLLQLALALACVTSDDCLLLGSCEKGICRCRQGFTGPECGQLDLAPAPNHLGYQNFSASTWGGLPLRVNDKWHMYVSMITGACPLGTFNNNSEIVHLVSTSSSCTGPYTYMDTVVGAFAHNAAPRILPDGSIGVWFIGYDGQIDTITCPGGIPPKDFIWPDWSGKRIALARSAPGESSGPWNITWLFQQTSLPADWWHWDCSATNPSAVVDSDGSTRMMYRGTMCTHCPGCPSSPPNALSM